MHSWISRCSCVFLSVAVLGAVGAAQPPWVSSYNPALSDYSAWEHPVLAGLSESIAPRSAVRVTSWVPLGTTGLALRGASVSGEIATGTVLCDELGPLPYSASATGTLSTPFEGVLSIDATPLAEPNQANWLIPVVGVDSGASTRVALLPWDGGGWPSWGEGVRFVTPLPGEVFLRASLVGHYLYVVDASPTHGPKLVRYVDSTHDGFPDTRDSGFSLPLDAHCTTIRPRAGAICELRWAEPTRVPIAIASVQVVREVSPGQYSLRKESGLAPGLHRSSAPFFAFGPVEGAQSLLIRAKAGTSLVVESHDPSSEEAEALTPAFAVPSDRSVVISPRFSKPLELGRLVKVRDLESGEASESRAVGVPEVRIFEAPRIVASGGVLVVRGSRLDLVTSVGLGDFIGLDSSGRRVTPAFPPPTFHFDPATESLTLTLPTTATAAHGGIHLHHPGVGLGRSSLMVSIRP